MAFFMEDFPFKLTLSGKLKKEKRENEKKTVPAVMAGSCAVFSFLSGLSGMGRKREL